MSASLVGSEMCIRDRSKEGGGDRRQQVRSPAQRAAGGGGHGGRQKGPVSYTHLTLPTICSV
eukprot:14032611-Alexandrium_andersonii.AAC.1